MCETAFRAPYIDIKSMETLCYLPFSFWTLKDEFGSCLQIYALHHKSQSSFSLVIFTANANSQFVTSRSWDFNKKASY